MITTLQGIDFDDILLVPKVSSLESRGDVSLKTYLGTTKYLDSITLEVPIVASPMKGIVGLELIKRLSRLGGIGILHRFYTDQAKRLSDIEELFLSNSMFGVAVGLNDDFYCRAANMGASLVCIDVANGYLASVRRFVEQVSRYMVNNHFKCNVMAGNVATYDGAESLYNSGATIIRVGIGSGKLCSTRNNTGIGVPQLSAISDCSFLRKEHYTQVLRMAPWSVVADGGIRNSGDAVKALAFGANAVMLGSLFARCHESDHNGEIQGSASREFQEEFYGEVQKSVEGIRISADKIVPLSTFIEEFSWNIRSGMAYLGERSIQNMHLYDIDMVYTGKGSIKSL